MTFRRLTAPAERPGSHYRYVQGDHQGLVSERMGWIYFQGSNRIEPREPTLLALKREASSLVLLAGFAMVITLAGPTIVSVVMTPAPRNTGVRAALKLARALPIDDPALGPQVVTLLQRARRT